MELRIFAKAFRRPDAQSTMNAVRSLGLGCVQFNFECAGLPSMPEEVPPPVLTAIAAASQGTGVRLAAISGTFNMAHSTGFSGPVIMHGFEENRAAESTAFARAKLKEVQTDHASP